ncbi:MAG TPA: PEP/pyruvate-binding domain-containing protein, partial [Marinobacter sp.]|nr:PEP/pyruvate-binding domain-containing protein [Marinobacter sp.]
MHDYIIWFEHLGMSDVDRVGGKNASLGEMISNLANAGVTVPGGFATTSYAYREFLATNGLKDKIDETLDALDVNDVNELARVGAKIRQWVIDTPFPDALDNALAEAYAQLQNGNHKMAVAVRSSATAEDLPDASFAGQQETSLNVLGLDKIRTSVKEVFASLFN